MVLVLRIAFCVVVATIITGPVADDPRSHGAWWCVFFAITLLATYSVDRARGKR